MAKAEEEKTVLLLQMKDGTQKKLTIPASWKVTFGPLVPGSKDGGNGYAGLCLRIYADRDRQKAVFTQVESFRDMSLPIMEQQSEKRTDVYRREGDESGEAIHAEVEVKRWVNPDDPKPSEPCIKGNQAEPGALVKLVRGVR